MWTVSLTVEIKLRFQIRRSVDGAKRAERYGGTNFRIDLGAFSRDDIERALAEEIVLCLWERQFTLTVPLSPRVYK